MLDVLGFIAIGYLLLLVLAGFAGLLLVGLIALVLAVPTPATVVPAESEEPKDLSQYRWTSWGEKIQTHNQRGYPVAGFERQEWERER